MYVRFERKRNGFKDSDYLAIEIVVNGVSLWEYHFTNTENAHSAILQTSAEQYCAPQRLLRICKIYQSAEQSK